MTVRTYGVFGTIRGLLIFVKVGARGPRPHLLDVFSDRLLGAFGEAFGFWGQANFIVPKFVIFNERIVTGGGTPPLP